MPRAFSALALALLSACEGTWGSPEFYPIAGLKDAYAMATICTIGRHACSGSKVEIQVQSLHEPRRYVGLIVSGTPCGGLSGWAIVKQLPLEPLADRAEGIDGRDRVMVPIHQLVKTNFSAAVLDTKTRRIIGCGALSSDRPL